MKPKTDKTLSLQATESPTNDLSIKGEAEALISQAIDKNVPVEALERLLVMRRELRAEHAKEAFDQAMATFQSKCPTIEKRKQGYNYKYAPLESIVEQVKNLLSANGFSYTFDTEEADNAVVIICNVKHIAGHAEVSKATIKKETTTKMNASQQSGAAMTYGKRYAFCNAFGILTGDEDTDAHSTIEQPLTIREMAEQKEKDQTQAIPQQEAGSPTSPMTEKQAWKIESLLEEKDKTMEDLEAVCEMQFHKPYSKIDRWEASQIIERLLNAKKGVKKPAALKEDVIDVDAADREIEQMHLKN